MTLGEIRTLTRRELDDEVGNDSSRYIKDYQIDAYANEAVIEACIRGRLLVDSSTAEICSIPIVAGTAAYPFDPRIIMILRGKMASSTTPLGRASFTMLDERYDNWEAQEGKVETFVTGMDKNQIRLFKVPVSDDTLKLTVIREPLESLVDDENVPEIHPRLHQPLILWIKHRAYQNQDSQMWDKNRSDVHLEMFERKFGKRPAELCDVFDAMHISEYTPESRDLYQDSYY